MNMMIKELSGNLLQFPIIDFMKLFLFIYEKFSFSIDCKFKINANQFL